MTLFSLASQAQTMLTVWTPSDEASVKPSLGPDSIIVVRGPKPLDTMALVGLEPVPVEDPV